MHVSFSYYTIYTLSGSSLISRRCSTAYLLGYLHTASATATFVQRKPVKAELRPSTHFVWTIWKNANTRTMLPAAAKIADCHRARSK